MPSKRVRLAALAAGIAALLTVAIAGFAFLPHRQGREQQSQAVDWDNLRLLKELGKEEGTVPGSALGLAGATCHVFQSQRFNRVVVVCV